MADIVLAECNGRAWLVSGEQYIDDLLANTLPPHVSIEVVACQSKTEVDRLWVQNAGPPDISGPAWMIHPAIVNRVRRVATDHNVFFAQWSAMLDDEAQTVIRSAAAWAAEHGTGEVALVRYLGAGSAPMLADLANLRTGLIEAQLAAQGVDPARIVRETRDPASVPGMTEESQRVDILVRDP